MIKQKKLRQRHTGLGWAVCATGASGRTSDSADDTQEMDSKRPQEQCRLLSVSHLRDVQVHTSSAQSNKADSRSI